MNGFLLRLLGCLTVSCEGGFTGRFLDLCRTHGVFLRSVKMKDGVLTALIAPNDLYLLRPIARESGMRVRVRSRHGAVFFVNSVKHRYGFFAGAALFLIAMLLLSDRVWRIDLKNNSLLYSDEQIYTALAAEGITLGTLRETINADYAENELLTSLDGLKRVAVSVRNSHVSVELADRDALASPTPKQEPPVDLIASADAFIKGVSALSGKAAVEKGDTVRAGDVLVSGVYETGDGSVFEVVASGEVIGQTLRQTEFFIPLTVTETALTGAKKKKISLFFYGFHVKFYREGGNRGEKCAIIEETEPLILLNCPLPVSVTVRTECKQKSEMRARTKEELAEAVAAAAKEYETSELKNAVIIRRDVSVQRGEDGLLVTVDYVCEENIAVPVKRGG